jgi:hypothetical protein
MSLSEKYRTREVARIKFENSIDRWLASLESPTERQAAEAMLQDTSWSQREIRWAFREEGFRVSEATIGEWRRVNGVTS